MDKAKAIDVEIARLMERSRETLEELADQRGLKGEAREKFIGDAIVFVEGIERRAN